ARVRREPHLPGDRLPRPGSGPDRGVAGARQLLAALAGRPALLRRTVGAHPPLVVPASCGASLRAARPLPGCDRWLYGEQRPAVAGRRAGAGVYALHSPWRAGVVGAGDHRGREGLRRADDAPLHAGGLVVGGADGAGAPRRAGRRGALRRIAVWARRADDRVAAPVAAGARAGAAPGTRRRAARAGGAHLPRWAG